MSMNELFSSSSTTPLRELDLQQRIAAQRTEARREEEVLAATSIEMQRGGALVRRREMGLPDYDGSYDAELFISTVGRTVRYNQWDEDATFIALMNSVKGQARIILTTFPPHTIPNSKMLLDALRARFGGRMSSQEASIKLASRRQEKDETLRQLALDLQSLVQHAYPFAEIRTQEDIAIREFVRGISESEIKKLLALHHPQNLQAAIGYAEEVEATLKLVNKPKPPKIILATELKDRDLHKEIEALRKEIVQLQTATQYSCATLQQPSYSSRRQLPHSEGPITCHRCGGIGHMLRECPSKDVNVQGNGQPRDVRRNISRRA
jgi:hypothetical protein